MKHRNIRNLLVALAAVFAHDVPLYFAPVVQKGHRLLYDVVVVRAGKPFVSGDDEQSARALVLVPVAEIEALSVLVGDCEHAVDLRLERGEIGSRPLEIRPRLAHLGRRDQIHRVGDLARIAHALDAMSDLVDCAHASALSSSRNLSAASAIAVFASSDSCPVDAISAHCNGHCALTYSINLRA